VGPTCQTPRTAPGPAVAHRCRVAATHRATHAHLKATHRTASADSLTRAAAASPLAPASRPSVAPLPRQPRPSRCHPDRRGPKPPTLFVAVPPAARRRRRAAVPAPVSRPFLGCHPCASAVSSLARRAAPLPCAARCAGRPSWAAHAAPAEAVGRARGPRQRHEHGSRLAWPWAVRPCDCGPHPHCVTGPSAVSTQWHSI
jgi:hypothetical protein